MFSSEYKDKVKEVKGMEKEWGRFKEKMSKVTKEVSRKLERKTEKGVNDVMM